MRPIRLKNSKGEKITLFCVTDISAKDEGCYSYHVIDHRNQVVVLNQDKILEYKFDSFVE